MLSLTISYLRYSRCYRSSWTPHLPFPRQIVKPGPRQVICKQSQLRGAQKYHGYFTSRRQCPIFLLCLPDIFILWMSSSPSSSLSLVVFHLWLNIKCSLIFRFWQILSLHNYWYTLQKGAYQTKTSVSSFVGMGVTTEGGGIYW